MFTALVIFHVFISASLVLVVLLQTSKGEALTGSALGGGIGGSFGPRSGGSFLSKVTTVLAIVFVLNCIGLALVSAGRRQTPQDNAGVPDPNVKSVVTEQMKHEMEKQQQQAAAQQPLPGDSGKAAPVTIDTSAGSQGVKLSPGGK